jgi:hypothetical protein
MNLSPEIPEFSFISVNCRPNPMNMIRNIQSFKSCQGSAMDTPEVKLFQRSHLAIGVPFTSRSCHHILLCFIEEYRRNGQAPMTQSACLHSQTQKSMKNNIFVVLLDSGARFGLRNPQGDVWRREISRSRGKSIFQTSHNSGDSHTLFSSNSRVKFPFEL